MSLSDHLHRLEVLLLAETARRDPLTLERLLADDFREFTASGIMCGKQEAINALQAEVFIERDIRDLALSTLSDDIALLTYTCVSSLNESLRTSIWRRTAEGWQLFFHQGTQIRPSDQ